MSFHALKANFPIPGTIIFYCTTAAFDPSIAGSLTVDYSSTRWLTAASAGPRMSVIALDGTRSDNADGSVTKSLEIALSEFGSILTDDERKQLQQIKSVPDASAALVFTARLDASNSARRGKSIGARAYSMLQSIQQFSTIIETFVSANPNIAALVWGSAKLTVLVSHLLREEAKRRLG